MSEEKAGAALAEELGLSASEYGEIKTLLGKNVFGDLLALI